MWGKIYIHTSVYMCECLYTYMHIYTYIYLYTYIDIHIDIYIYIRSCLCAVCQCVLIKLFSAEGTLKNTVLIFHNKWENKSHFVFQTI